MAISSQAYKVISFRCPLGLYEEIEREAMARKVSVAEIIIENTEGFRSLRAAAVSTTFLPEAT